MLLPLALRWSEAGMGGQHLASSSSNKLEASALDLMADGRRSPFWFLPVLFSLSVGLDGEGEKEFYLQAAGFAGRLGSLTRSGRYLELFQADGCFAVAIHCRSGGRSSTSGAEAISLPGHGSSKPVHHEVIHSSWRSGGPCSRLVVGRGLPSCRPLFLGGDALRTPARGGGGAQGLDCRVSFSFRVLVVKRSAFFVVWTFPRARLQRLHQFALKLIIAAIQFKLSCTCLFNIISIFGAFQALPPLQKKGAILLREDCKSILDAQNLGFFYQQ
jgi:hypothetical protein